MSLFQIPDQEFIPLSYLIAKILGVVYTLVGLSVLFNPSYHKKFILELVRNRAIMFAFTFISLPVFVVWVLKHNIWHGWPILITLFGWTGLLKDILFFLFPFWSEKMTLAFVRWVNIRAWWGGFGLFIGLLFSYLGWLAA